MLSLLPRTAALRRYARHPLILYYYAPALLFGGAQALLLPVLPLYVDDFGVSYGVTGLVLACQGIGTMVGDLPSGALMGRWGSRAVMLTGLGLNVGAMLTLVFARVIWIVVISQVVAGVGMAMFAVAQHITLTSAVGLEQRGRASAVSGGMSRISNFAGPVIGGAVASALGLRAPFWLVIAGTLTAMALVARYLPDSGRQVSVGHAGVYLLATLRAHRRVLMTAGLGVMLVTLVRRARNVILPLIGADVIGLDVAAIGVIVSLGWAIEVVLFPLAGVIMDRWGRKWAIVPSFVIQAAGMIVMALAGSFAGLVAAGVLIGLGNGFSSGSMMVMGADLAPEEGRGQFLGVWWLIADVGSAGAPLLVGGIADLLTLPAAAGTLALMAMLAALTFGRAVPETLKRPRPSGASG